MLLLFPVQKTIKSLIWFRSVNHCVLHCLAHLGYHLSPWQSSSSQLPLLTASKRLHFRSTIYGALVLFIVSRRRRRRRRGKSCSSHLREEAKVKDYGVTSCVARERNVNKYNLTWRDRIFWHLWTLFIAFPLNAFFSPFVLFSLSIFFLSRSSNG